MPDLSETVKISTKPVYVHFMDEETAKKFLIDAEKHGFKFTDGTRPTEKMPDSFFALHSDRTMNYIGAVGRIAYQCRAGNIIPIDYAEKTAE